MFLAFFWISVCVASTCSTSDVPMPCASAPNAPCVEVWLSPQTMVVPGSVKPCSGPITWTMPWRLSNSLKYSMPNSLAFSAITLHLLDAFRIGIGLRTIGGRDVVIHHGQRLLRRVHLAAGGAQSFEGLRRGHLVHQMAVDIEQAGAVVGFVHQMVVPDLVVQRGRIGHERQLQKKFCVSGQARIRASDERQRSIKLRA